MLYMHLPVGTYNPFTINYGRGVKATSVLARIPVGSIVPPTPDNDNMEKTDDPVQED